MHGSKSPRAHSPQVQNLISNVVLQYSCKEGRVWLLHSTGQTGLPTTHSHYTSIRPTATCNWLDRFAHKKKMAAESLLSSFPSHRSMHVLTPIITTAHLTNLYF